MQKLRRQWGIQNRQDMNIRGLILMQSLDFGDAHTAAAAAAKTGLYNDITLWL